MNVCSLFLCVTAALCVAQTINVRFILTNGVSTTLSMKNSASAKTWTSPYRNDVSRILARFQLSSRSNPRGQIKIGLYWTYDVKTSCLTKGTWYENCPNDRGRDCQAFWGTQTEILAETDFCQTGENVWRPRYFQISRSWRCKDSYNTYVPAVSISSLAQKTIGTSSTATVGFTAAMAYTALVSNTDVCRVYMHRFYITRNGNELYMKTFNINQTVGKGSKGSFSTTISLQVNNPTYRYYQAYAYIGSYRDGLQYSDGFSMAGPTKFCLKYYPSTVTPSSIATNSFTDSTGKKITLKWPEPKNWGWPCNSGYTQGTKSYSVQIVGYSTLSATTNSTTTAN